MSADERKERFIDVSEVIKIVERWITFKILHGDPFGYNETELKKAMEKIGFQFPVNDVFGTKVAETKLEVKE